MIKESGIVERFIRATLIAELQAERDNMQDTLLESHEAQVFINLKCKIAELESSLHRVRETKEHILTLDFVRLGVKAGLLMAAADCGNHSESCMEDAMTSAGLSKLDKKMLDAECNAANAIRKQITTTCEDSALGYAAYMLPEEDQAALAVLGVTSDWLYRRTTGEPSRKEILDPVAPRAVAETDAVAPGDGGLVSGASADPSPLNITGLDTGAVKTGVAG